MTDKQFSSPPCFQHELEDIPNAGDEWEGIRRWRNAQRQRLKTIRDHLPGRDQARLGRNIRAHLASGLGADGRCLAFYWPLPGEPDLRPFIKAHIEKGGSAALAVIARKEQPLEFWHWDESTRMEDGGVWNIPTPAERQVIVPDVVLVPLVGFDESGHRLGNGGGYYERSRSALESKPLCIGVGYAKGRLEQLHPPPHDVQMDAIVTENGFDWQKGRRPSTPA